MTVVATPITRELDARQAGEMSIRLLWDGKDMVWVEIQDRAMFCIVNVPEDTSALDVFRHPFVYAGRQAVQIARLGQ